MNRPTLFEPIPQDEVHRLIRVLRIRDLAALGIALDDMTRILDNDGTENQRCPTGSTPNSRRRSTASAYSWRSSHSCATSPRHPASRPSSLAT
ncbi:hypothetical protein [Pseudoclavibacter helvolus]|uniref:hypothetical protein n=1 Tax=Pseudoclavibacter helvolus TaxID=255205 RepID=UPI003736388E